MSYWIGLLFLGVLFALLVARAFEYRLAGTLALVMIVGALPIIGCAVETYYVEPPSAHEQELSEDEAFRAELRALFIHPGAISLRDPDDLAIRDDVSEAIRAHLTADNCRYLLADDYSEFDWAVNIALSIDGLPIVAPAQLPEPAP